MRFLVALLSLLSLFMIRTSEGSGDSSLKLIRQRYNLEREVEILHNLIERDCPGHIRRKRMIGITVEVKEQLVKHLKGTLKRCREEKGGRDWSTEDISVELLVAATTRGRSSAAQRNTTVKPTTGAGTLAPSCTFNHRYSKLTVAFTSYHNEGDRRVTGAPCDGPGDSCDIFLEICISQISQQDCSLYKSETEVIANSSNIWFTPDLGRVRNPVEVRIRDYKGINLQVTVWDRDQQAVRDDMVDEFQLDFMDPAGTATKTLELESKRHPASSMKLEMKVYCPLVTSQDCQELYESGERQDGVYQLRLSDGRLVEALCQFDESAGWTVIQARKDGSEDFNRRWQNYVDGFGNADGEFWIGLEAIHLLTATNNKLSILMGDFSNNFVTANYSSFSISDSTGDYRLQVSGYSGDAGDSFSSYHNGMKFSTRDRDNDATSSRSCAVVYPGGWWYKDCYNGNLNNPWVAGGTIPAWSGIVWQLWKGETYSLKTAYMRVTRPTS